MKNLLVLDSLYRTNQEDQDGYAFWFKLNKTVKLNGPVRLEQFIFQNSQYVFSEEKKSNKFLLNDIPFTIRGKFDTIDAFVKEFNSVIVGQNIKMLYTPHLYEIKILHNTGLNFSFTDFYLDGTFMNFLGFSRINTGSNSYTNINIPRLFSQTLIYITLPELGVYNTYTKDSKPYTYVIASQPGFEIVANLNSTFDNVFYVSNKDLDEITVQIRDNTGMSFTNNKGDSNFIMILSY